MFSPFQSLNHCYQQSVYMTNGFAKPKWRKDKSSKNLIRLNNLIMLSIITQLVLINT